jgi:hypothetical protein
MGYLPDDESGQIYVCNAALPTAEEKCSNVSELMRGIDLESAEKKEVSVGAGAEIYQDLNKDPLKVSEWEEEASATIRLYFVFANEFKSIIANGGVKDMDGVKEGFLKGLPVG